mgnify:CR=1 FL=1
MQVQQTIIQKLEQALTLEHLEVRNESHMHSVPPNSETHFKIVAVTEGFEGKRRVARHQQLYQLLTDELDGGVHALALHLFTPDEWQAQNTVPESPNCLGGSKADKL